MLSAKEFVGSFQVVKFEDLRGLPNGWKSSSTFALLEQLDDRLIVAQCWNGRYFIPHEISDGDHVKKLSSRIELDGQHKAIVIEPRKLPYQLPEVSVQLVAGMSSKDVLIETSSGTTKHSSKSTLIYEEAVFDALQSYSQAMQEALQSIKEALIVFDGELPSQVLDAPHPEAEFDKDFYFMPRISRTTATKKIANQYRIENSQVNVVWEASNWDKLQVYLREASNCSRSLQMLVQSAPTFADPDSKATLPPPLIKVVPADQVEVVADIDTSDRLEQFVKTLKFDHIDPENRLVYAEAQVPIDLLFLDQSLQRRKQVEATGFAKTVWEISKDFELGHFSLRTPESRSNTSVPVGIEVLAGHLGIKMSNLLVPIELFRSGSFPESPITVFYIEEEGRLSVTNGFHRTVAALATNVALNQDAIKLEARIYRGSYRDALINSCLHDLVPGAVPRSDSEKAESCQMWLKMQLLKNGDLGYEDVLKLWEDYKFSKGRFADEFDFERLKGVLKVAKSNDRSIPTYFGRVFSQMLCQFFSVGTRVAFNSSELEKLPGVKHRGLRDVFHPAIKEHGLLGVVTGVDSLFNLKIQYDDGREDIATPILFTISTAPLPALYTPGEVVKIDEKEAIVLETSGEWYFGSATCEISSSKPLLLIDGEEHVLMSAAATVEKTGESREIPSNEDRAQALERQIQKASGRIQEGLKKNLAALSPQREKVVSANTNNVTSINKQMWEPPINVTVLAVKTELEAGRLTENDLEQLEQILFDARTKIAS